MFPYIGITDFTDFEQVKEMLRVFESHKPRGSKRRLHVGVMMSHKTLNGVPSQWQTVFPSKETIAQIFSSAETYNCLHYADYDDNPGLEKNIFKAIYFGGQNMRAIQLDMIWPNPDEIRDGVSTSCTNVEVILQINKQAFEDVNNNPEQLTNRLRKYEGVVQRVLLDKSMGRGKKMNAEELIPFATALRKKFPALAIGAAGGLGPETVHLVRPLLKVVPDISIDAQGQLRPSGSALDPIDWTLAKRYLIEAHRLFI